MTLKNKHFIVGVNVYKVDVLFMVGLSDKQFDKVLNEYRKYNKIDEETNSKTLSVDEGVANGWHVGLSSGSSIIRLREFNDNYLDRSTLTHELLHAVFHIMEHVGITLSESSEEAFTYLLGYLERAFYNSLKIAEIDEQGS